MYGVRVFKLRIMRYELHNGQGTFELWHYPDQWRGLSAMRLLLHRDVLCRVGLQRCVFVNQDGCRRIELRLGSHRMLHRIR